MKIKKYYFGCILLIVFANNVFSQTPVKLSNDQFQFTEGPVWDGQGNVYFTDIPKSEVIKYNENDGSFSLAFANSNRGNGLMFNANNKLTVCQGGSGSITLRETDGTIIRTLANTFNGVRFNGPNDLCYDTKGGFYFTDPGFESTSQPSRALFYVTSNGEVFKQDDFGNTNPNGVIISEDGKKLYVNNTSIKEIYCYDIHPDTGALSNRILFGELPDFIPNSGADGMAVDVSGKLYVTAKTKLQVFNGLQLTPTQSITFPEKITNCTFGGVNKAMLYVTGVNNLYRLDVTPAVGIHHPFDLPGFNLSAQRFNDLNDFVIYPNPMSLVSKEIYLSRNLSKKITSVELFDMASKKLKTPNIETSGIDNGDSVLKFDDSLLSGSYVLKINIDNKSITKKIIVK